MTKTFGLLLFALALIALAPATVVAQGVDDLKSTLDHLDLEYSEEVLDWLVNSDHDGPFHMVNLLKFRKEAEYPDGYKGKRAKSGVEANQLYIEALRPLIEQAGNSSVVRNRVIGTVAWIGNDEEWDMIAVVYYPNRDSFVRFLSNPLYREAGAHKHAALERTRAIITLPGGPIVDPTRPAVINSEK